MGSNRTVETALGFARRAARFQSESERAGKCTSSKRERVGEEVRFEANRSRLAIRPLLEPKGRLRSIHQRPRRESPVSPTVTSAGGATFCSSRFSVRALSLFLRPRPYVSECPCAAGCCNWRRYKNSPIRLPVRLGNTLELAVKNEKGRWSAA